MSISQQDASQQQQQQQQPPAGPEQQQQVQQQQQGTEKSLLEIQLAAQCNWCLNPLVMSGTEFTESNFIDTGKTFDGTTKATAPYCTDCLADSFRVSQPKSALNKVTLARVDVSGLV